MQPNETRNVSNSVDENNNNIEEIIEELRTIYPDRDDFIVMIAGTFDIIHTGHIYYIQQAAKIGKVYVIVARDKSVIEFKGKPPIFPENQRLEIIRAIKGVWKASLGEDHNERLNSIKEVNPDIFLMGPTQFGNEKEFEEKVRALGCKTIFRRLKSKYSKFELDSSTKIKNKIISNAKMNQNN